MKPPKIQLLRLNPSHLDELVLISRETFIDAFASQNDPIHFQQYTDRAFASEQILSELENPNSEFYFLKNNDTTVGYIKINTGAAQNEYQEDVGMELERIYVLPAYQGKGLGKLVLDEVIDIAIAKAKSYVWLGVWDQNTRAIDFYERHGFERVGEHDFYLGEERQTDYLMKKSL